MSIDSFVLAFSTIIGGDFPSLVRYFSLACGLLLMLTVSKPSVAKRTELNGVGLFRILEGGAGTTHDSIDSDIHSYESNKRILEPSAVLHLILPIG